MNVRIRNLRKKDLEPIKDIITNTWYEQFFDDRESLVEALITIKFISPLLNKVTFAKVAEIDNKVVGVILGSRVGQPPIYKKWLSDYSSEIIELLSATEYEQKILLTHITKIKKAYNELIAGKEKDYQGTLELFALTKEAQGKHIGKKLLEEFIGYEKKLLARKIYLYTDNTSNFGFYEHMGFVHNGTVKNTLILPEGKFIQRIFLYDYSL